MKKIIYLFFVAAIAGTVIPSCKSKKKEAPAEQTTTVDTTATTVPPPAPPPVEIAPADSLTQGLKDATKDFPEVTATVNDGEVTLTGTIKRSSLPKLMQSVHALKPKKINNNLTIK